VPAALYCAAAVASWLAITAFAGAGIALAAAPQYLVHSIPPDYLIFSSPDAETWTLLQMLTGVATLLAALAIVRDERQLVRRVAWIVVAAMAMLAVATLADVARQWAQVDYGAWFLLRYLNGERFSLHMQDLNAAGSLYVLAVLAAVGLAVFEPARRAQWVLGLMVPALWLSGSRSAFVALAGGLLVLGAAQSRWRPTRSQLTVAATLVAIVLLAGALLADWRNDVQGSAGRAVSLRSQFSQATLRMFASAPVFGVGVGHYFPRSSEFMSEELRALYGSENAHNYFAQQFAELGLVGGMLFGWLIVSVLMRGWQHVRTSMADGAAIALFVGAAGYVLTCLTGHPLLVSEAAVPFWIAFGTTAGASRDDADGAAPPRWTTAAVVAVLLVGLAAAAVPDGDAEATPIEQGFHGEETAADGVRFRWMTRHGITHVPAGPGFVRLTLRAPDLALARPLTVETSVAGRVLDRREVPQGGWITYDVPVRQRGPAPFRRVDIRVNQSWTDEVRLGRRTAQRPIAVMVGDVRWIGLR
jgi:O-antigen ligase